MYTHKQDVLMCKLHAAEDESISSAEMNWRVAAAVERCVDEQ
jgi:hypothetical protein